MLNRLIIFSLLVFSTVAIPMQNDTNFLSRNIQSVGFNNCFEPLDKMIVVEDIINKVPEIQQVNTNCQN